MVTNKPEINGSPKGDNLKIAPKNRVIFGCEFPGCGAEGVVTELGVRCVHHLPDDLKFRTGLEQ